MRLALLITLGLLAPRSAAAECTEPPVFSPPKGTHVPAHPTFLVTLPTPELHDLDVRSAHARRVLASGADFALVRVDSYATTGKLDVMVSRPRRIHFSDYELGDSDPNVVEIIGVTRSDEQTVEITATGNPIGFRFAWDDGRSTVIATAEQGHHLVARLGKVPCFGWNLDAELLAQDRAFALFALFADGSEQRLGVSRLQLAEDVVQMPTDLVGAQLGRVPRAAPPPPIVRTEHTTIIQRAPWPGWSGALGGFAVILGAAFLRRRRRDHRPRYR